MRTRAEVCGRHALAAGDAGCVGVAQESLHHDRRRQAFALYVGEERRLGIAGAKPEVVDEEGSSAGWIGTTR
jgi:hypothetical protein